MPIHITRLSSGALLIQRDAVEIVIDHAATTQALPAVLLTLTESSKVIGQARRQGYEDGLVVGHANGVREERERMQREAERMDEERIMLIGAPMAA